jgi:cell division inhibitor SulA
MRLMDYLQSLTTHNPTTESAMLKTEPVVVGPLSLPTLIACLEERIVALREAGETPIVIGGLPELLEQAIMRLRSAARARALFEIR